MNEPDSENEFSLIPYPSRELIVPQGAEKRILSEMIESSLELARESDTRKSPKQQPSQEDFWREQRAKPGFQSRMEEAKTSLRYISLEGIPTRRQDAHVDLDALVREGKRLCRGEGMTEENIRAFQLFLRAAEAGHAEAQNDLGDCYSSGEGVPRDEGEALSWLTKAAENGHEGAQLGLAYCYRSGEAAPLDEAEANKWFKKAAKQGNSDAQYELGNYLISIRGDGMDFSEARNREYNEGVKWLRKAAEQGQRNAQWTLGYYYHSGSGRIPLPHNKLEAYKWLQLAADQGHKHVRKMAEALAATMSPSDVEAAQRIYREFKEKHSE